MKILLRVLGTVAFLGLLAAPAMAGCRELLLRGTAQTFLGLAISPKEDRAAVMQASATQPGRSTLELRDARGELIKSFDSGIWPITAAEFTPDGRFLVFIAANGRLSFVHASDGSVIGRASIEQEDPVSALNFPQEEAPVALRFPEKDALLIVGDRGSVKRVDFEVNGDDGLEVYNYEELRDRFDTSRKVSPVFLGQDQELFIAHPEGMYVHYLNISDGGGFNFGARNPQATGYERVTSIHPLGDGRHLLLGTESGLVRIFDSARAADLPRGLPVFQQRALLEWSARVRPAPNEVLPLQSRPNFSMSSHYFEAYESVEPHVLHVSAFPKENLVLVVGVDVAAARGHEPVVLSGVRFTLFRWTTGEQLRTWRTPGAAQRLGAGAKAEKIPVVASRDGSRLHVGQLDGEGRLAEMRAFDLKALIQAEKPPVKASSKLLN